MHRKQLGRLLYQTIGVLLCYFVPCVYLECKHSKLGHDTAKIAHKLQQNVVCI